MKLTFLGTGTSTGVPQIGCKCQVCKSKDSRDKRLRSSVLIETKEKRILIDAGPDLRQQLLANDISSLDGVLITHEHYDHIGGLDDLRPLGQTTVFCEKNVAKTIKTNMYYSFTLKKYPGVPNIELEEITDKVFFLQNLKIIPIRVIHAKLPILGYRIGDLAYLTDVKIIPEDSFEKLKGLKVLIINALREEEHIAHLNLQQAIEIAQKIGAENTYFTHFSHQIGLHKVVDAGLPENIHLSYDNLTLKI